MSHTRPNYVTVVVQVPLDDEDALDEVTNRLDNLSDAGRGVEYELLTHENRCRLGLDAI